MFEKKSPDDDMSGFPFMDFLDVLAHTYHRIGYPAPGFGRVFSAASWLVSSLLPAAEIVRVVRAVLLPVPAHQVILIVKSRAASLSCRP